LEAAVHCPIHWVTQADLQEKAHAEQLQQEAQKTQNLLDEITKIKEIAKEKVSFCLHTELTFRQRLTELELVMQLRPPMS
jgi:hypothetical protein